MTFATRWIVLPLAAGLLLAGGCGKKDKNAESTKTAGKAPRLSPTTTGPEAGATPPGGAGSDEMGFTNLHDAAARREGIAQALRRPGANVNARDKVIGWTALHWAASDGDSDMVRTLQVAGADINAGDLKGKTPLHVACAAGQLQAVQTLLDMRANPNAVDMNGLTALHHAVIGGNKEVVGLLLAKGVKVDAVTKAGATPLQMAIYGSKHDIADLLRSRGAAPAKLPDRDDPIPQPPATMLRAMTLPFGSAGSSSRIFASSG